MEHQSSEVFGTSEVYVVTRSLVVSMPVLSSSKDRTISRYTPSRGGERSLPFGEEKRISVPGPCPVK